MNDPAHYATRTPDETTTDMTSLLSEGIERYIHEHTTPESELFERLRRETEERLDMPQMQVGRVEGQLLRMLVEISNARKILEIGTFSGYSALAMASGLPEGGELITCDIDAKATAIAQRFFDEAPWGHKIHLRLAPAMETLEDMTRKGAVFDFVFIDADKVSYLEYWKKALPIVAKGGLILADNTLWGGAVLDPQGETDDAIVRFNAHVRSDPRVEHVLLSVRDGIMLARKL